MVQKRVIEGLPKNTWNVSMVMALGDISQVETEKQHF